MGREAEGTGRRQMDFLLAEPERRLLRRIAAGLPAWVGSDHLTVLGVVGAVGAGVCYALSADNAAWLWAASALLAVNWFGDSLDGTLARVRRTERPRYGYYLDHAVDAFNVAALGIGFGLSPFASMEVALGLVVVYMVLSINVYLETAVFGVFRMAYGWFGPTEARISLMLMNAALFVASAPGGVPRALPAAADVLLAASGGVMLVALLLRFGRNLRRLSEMEPL